MRTTRRRCVGRGEEEVSQGVLHSEEVGGSVGQPKDVAQVPGEGVRTRIIRVAKRARS